MKRKYLLLLVVSCKLSLYLPPVFAQPNIGFGKNVAEETQKPGWLIVGVQTHTYLKNNEYFGPIIQGYTLVGHLLHPYVCYNPTKEIQVKGGIFMKRAFASPHFFSKLYPTFSLQYQNQSIRFLLGTMEQPCGQYFIHPLYNRERFLERGCESGFQLQYMGGHNQLEVWLEWLALLDQQANKPEELCAGLAWQHVLCKKDKIKISIPIQLCLYHLGGQNITIRDYSLLLGAVGATVSFVLPEYGALNSVRFKNYWVFNRYIKEVTRPFKQGKAFYSQLQTKIAWLNLTLSYWQGQGFISENLGEPLYQSIAWSGSQVTYQEKSRKLLLIDFMVVYELSEQLILNFCFAPYYDFKNHCLEHSEGITVTYNLVYKHQLQG